MRVSLGCSIGVAMFSQDATTYEALLHTADSRMYSEKTERKTARR